ncbi:MAG: hypothetical protein JSW66_02080 [Phycisphaerales bacterium]|nr:MAG: hypothetical protein JSW66_02080 [Phycisphaerales bacterium]
MGSFSDYWENKVLDHIFGNDSYTPPTIFVALSTAEPLDDASGVAEPSGNGYARVETGASDWSVSSGGSVSNATSITFPTASGSWGTITHFGLFDSVTGGNMLAYGALNQPKAIGNSDTGKFEAGDLEINLD